MLRYNKVIRISTKSDWLSLSNQLHLSIEKGTPAERRRRKAWGLRVQSYASPVTETEVQPWLFSPTHFGHLTRATGGGVAVMHSPGASHRLPDRSGLREVNRWCSAMPGH